MVAKLQRTRVMDPISNEKRVPVSCVDSTCSDVPMDRRKSWQIASPRPAFENRIPDALGRKPVFGKRVVATLIEDDASTRRNSGGADDANG